jgi:ribosome biogenesis GTPase
MARDKGKSRRRRKDWQQRYEAGEDFDAAAQRSGFSEREVKLGDGSFGGGAADELADREIREGMITGVFQRGSFVRVGEEELYCGIAKTFRPPDGAENVSPLAVGDDVSVALVPEALQAGRTELDRNRMDGMILSRRPRKTVLSRMQTRRGKRRDAYDETVEKVIAANMDQLLVVLATAQPPMRRRLIDRFMIVAERGGLDMLLAVNKIDLGPGDEKILADISALKVPIVRCSAATGAGVDALAERLAGKRSVLAGASGVGKTSLINRVVPEAEGETRSVRAKDQRGRHTTSQSRVYDLPRGGMLVDTPGVRELGLDLQPQELPWFFPEIEEYAPKCKFNDCTHTHEPDCAVRAAVEAGLIRPRRYESYLRILETLEDAG